MSIKLMSQVWGLDLKRDRKIVLMALADHADDEGYCYPSAAYVGWKTDYSERQIQRILDKLEKDRLIRVAKEHTPTTPRIYQLLLDNAPKKEKYKRKPVGRGNIFEGVTSGQRRGDILSSRGDIAVSPEPSYNHQEEPVSETDVSESVVKYYENGKEVDNHIPPLPAGGEKLNYEQKLDRALNPKEKEEMVYEPKTNLSRFMQEMSKGYGNKRAYWIGFQSAEERDDWLEMEQKFQYKEIEETIRWAISNHFSKKTLARKVIVAINNNPRVKAKSTKQIGKAVKAEDGGVYV